MSTISAGTTTPTALSLSGDTTGALTFQVNGTTTAATITSAGNVGIGTSSPTTKLTVSSATNAGISVTDGTVTTILYNTSSANGSVGTTSNHPMAFYTNNAERMRISSTGSVGIGSTTPGTYSEKLIVQSTASTQASMMWLNPGQGSGQIGIAASGSNFKLYNTYTDGLLANGNGIDITSAGNVGIGTASPSFKFEVQQGSSGASPSLRQTPQVVLKGYGGSSTYHSGIGFSMYEHTNGYWGSGILEVDDSGSYGAAMAFYTSTGSATPTPSERMRITTGGNLLLGTAADLGQNARLNILTASGEADVITMRYTDAAAGKHWRIYIDSNSTFYLANQGNVGVYITDGGNTWNSLSDERLKTDLMPIEDSLSKIGQLRAVTGRFKTDEEGTSRSFLIAQDVQKVFPEAVSAINPDELGLRYTDMIPLLVAAIKEQQEQIKALQDKVTALETK